MLFPFLSDFIPYLPLYLLRRWEWECRGDAMRVSYSKRTITTMLNTADDFIVTLGVSRESSRWWFGVWLRIRDNP
jgi:hypothetical protein